MKRFFLIFFLGLIFLLVGSSPAFASLIFQDSFQGGINNNEWTVLTRSGDGAYFNNSPFGIQDTSTLGHYTILDSTINGFVNNNEIRVDVKINNNDPSTFTLFCRNNQDISFNSGFGAEFYNSNIFEGFGANTFDSVGAIDAVGFNWDRSNGIHHFDIVCNNSHISIQEDGNYLYNDNSHNYAIGTGNFVSLTFGDGHTSEFANFQMCDINGCSSPTPTPIQLPVTTIKQTDPHWSNGIYDMANIWSPHNMAIGTWGCALTSADMILKYYGIDYLPGYGKMPLTPLTLDAWLNTQPDGYVPNGNVNWMAIARLSKDAPKNNSTLLDALEYERSNFMDTSTLLSDLEQNHPDILEEPGHFVVATGQNTNKFFTIADPYYNRTLLSDYGNTFLSLGRFIPSFTDLSYLLFTNDPSLTVTLKDKANTSVGTSYVQQPLQGAGTSLIAGNPINLLYLQQPGNGKYTLTVSASTTQIYTIKGFLYNKDGNVMPFTQTGVVDPNNQNIININYDNQNLQNDITQKNITISTFLSDLNDLYKLKQVKEGANEPLKELGKSVQQGMQKHNSIQVKVQLAVISNLLEIDKKIGLITNTAYQILYSDIKYLQSH